MTAKLPVVRAALTPVHSRYRREQLDSVGEALLSKRNVGGSGHCIHLPADTRSTR